MMNNVHLDELYRELQGVVERRADLQMHVQHTTDQAHAGNLTVEIRRLQRREFELWVKIVEQERL